MYREPLYEAYVEAGKQAGYAFTEDYNGAENEGFTWIQSTMVNGRRCSAAVAYLKPAMARPNVTVEMKAMVTRVLLEGDKAVGIEYEQNGQLQQVRADREVILSGGVINSPQVLMLSGIGDPEELGRVGIDTKVRLDGVGKNLQDHLSVGVIHSRPDPGPYRKEMRADRLLWNMARSYMGNGGPATDMPSTFMAHLKSKPGLDVPDIQFLFRGVPMHAEPWFPVVKPAWEDGFANRPVLLHPESRGELKLASDNPKDLIKIHQNFLKEENDRRTIRDGVRMARDIANQKALEPVPRQGAGAGSRRQDGRRAGRVHPTDRADGASPLRHLQDGHRRYGGRRPGAQGPRRRRITGDRRIGVPRFGRRQHQRADHHDRRKGVRSDPRQDSADARGGVERFPLRWICAV